jgi:hypothetical protein
VTDHYVSPAGLNTNPGTLLAPWDFAHALAGAGGAIVPGDTMWLRGGTYMRGPTWIHAASGALGAGLDDLTTKLKWRNYPGEFVSIATTDEATEVIRIDGTYNLWWATVGRAEGIEFWRNTPTRLDVRGTNIWFGFTPQTGNKLIHVVTRDGSNGVLDGGFNPDYDYGDIELYGVIAYNNGEVSDGGALETHGFYFRHQGVGTKAKVTKCILFNQVGYGLHHWAERADGMRNIESTDNIIWGAGVLGPLNGDTAANILFAAANGVGAPLRGIVCSRNILLQLKQDDRSQVQLILGGLSTETNEDTTCEDNYIVGGGRHDAFATIRVFKFQLAGGSLTFRRNKVIPLHDGNILENTQAGALTYAAWADNEWYSAAANAAWRQAGGNLSFAAWKAATGLGASDTAGLAKPTINKVFVIPVDKYNPGYAHVCFFNWAMTPTVAVNLSTVFQVGEAFEVYNVQDIFGAPVVRGIYGGGEVAFPTTGRPVPLPVGVTPRPPIATAPFFDAFLVRRASVSIVAGQTGAPMSSTLLSRFAAGIPIVTDNSDRTQQFATPATNQRVFNLTTRAIERWDGAAWVTDFGGGGAFVIRGAGSPEGAVSAPVGELYIQTDGGSGEVLWRKTSGVGSTGWTTYSEFLADLVAPGGFRQSLDGWYQENVAANQVNVELTRAAGRFRAARAGSVTAVVVTATEARTVGTLTIKVYKNTGLAGAAGAQLGTITAVLDGTNTSRKATTQAKDTDAFAAGDELYLTVTTDAGWLPVTADVRAALEIED